MVLTHSHTMTPFDTSGKEAFFKTGWEKEKMLVTSIFSFSHNIFYSITDRNYHLCYIYFVVYKCLQFEHGQIFVVWEWVKLFSFFYSVFFFSKDIYPIVVPITSFFFCPKILNFTIEIFLLK